MHLRRPQKIINFVTLPPTTPRPRPLLPIRKNEQYIYCLKLIESANA